MQIRKETRTWKGSDAYRQYKQLEDAVSLMRQAIRDPKSLQDMQGQYARTRKNTQIALTKERTSNTIPNTYRWTVESGALSRNGQRRFMEKWSQISNGLNVAERNVNGEYIISTGTEYGLDNEIVIARGNHDNPEIVRTYQIMFDTETGAEQVRDDVIKYEKELGEDAASIIDEVYGNGFVVFHNKSDNGNGVSKWGTGESRRTGSYGGEDSWNLGEQQNGRGDHPEAGRDGIQYAIGRRQFNDRTAQRSPSSMNR